MLNDILFCNFVRFYLKFIHATTDSMRERYIWLFLLFLLYLAEEILFDRKSTRVRVNKNRNIPDLLCRGDRSADLSRDIQFRRASFYVISVPILTRSVPPSPYILDSALCIGACMSFANRPINTNLLSSHDYA